LAFVPWADHLSPSSRVTGVRWLRTKCANPVAALEVQVKPKYWEGYSLGEDEERAEELFLGRVVKNNETGRSSDEYPIRDSSREREALAALVRLLQ
jgi:hypothetical protein